MIISFSRRFIFIHIHKAGGTSMQCALKAFLTPNDLLLGGSTLEDATTPHLSSCHSLYKHSSIRDVQAIYGSRLVNNFFSFSLVRDPLTRICSLYNFVGSSVLKEVNIRGVKHSDLTARHTQLAKTSVVFRWPASRAFIATNDFSEFIRSPLLRKDPGFDTQVSRLISSQGEMLVNAIKLEEISSGLSWLNKKLQIKISLPHKNGTRTQLIAPTNVSSADRDYIEHEFYHDYELLGY